MDPHEEIETIVEPFDPSKHDRTAFSCGVTQVDNYFKLTANKLAENDHVRLYAMTTNKAELVGFFALNSHAVHYTELPAKFKRNRPGHGMISAAYISMMGVDERFQGHKLGELVIVEALTRIAEAAKLVASAVVMLDVLDCGDPIKVEKRKRLYQRFEFLPLPTNPMRFFLPIATVHNLILDMDKGDEEDQHVPQTIKCI